MTAALSVTATKTRNNATASLTGGPASQAVVFVASPTGTAAGQQETINAVTDGTGAATVNFVPPSPGTLQIRVIQHQPDVVIAGPSSATVTAG
jgi:hypothetical protein